MSRAAAASSQPAQNSIWQLTIKLPQEKLSTHRTQKVGANAWQVNAKENHRGLLAVWLQMLIDIQKDDQKIIDRNAADIQPNETYALYVPGKTKGLVFSIWALVAKFGLGDDAYFVGNYAFCSRITSQSNLLTLYRLSIHADKLVEAVLHGDEKMVCDILNAAPDLLLKTGTAMDYHGRTFTGTPLQAAIAVDDIAPNANSTGTVEIILEQLKQLDPNHYQNTFEQQAGELYKKSLRVYVSIQEKEIARLCQLGGELPTNDPQQTGINEKMRQAQANLRAYAEALCGDDLNTLFETHKKAQADNAFDFKPYVDAILAIDLNDPNQKAELDDVMALINAKTPEETAAAIARTGVASAQTDEARAKLFDQLTLVQKLNRFREKFVTHTEKEIIFNSNHILSGLKANDAVWDTLPHAQDQQYHKRTVIFSQLVGWAQRNAAEPIRQDIRQGTWYLTEENQRRSRQSSFNALDSNYSVVKNSLVDVSISGVVDGIGYKFGGVAVGAGPWRCAWWWRFQNLCRTKTTSLQNLLRGERNQLTAA
jgi:hypothetical protein